MTTESIAGDAAERLAELETTTDYDVDTLAPPSAFVDGYIEGYHAAQKNQTRSAEHTGEGLLALLRGDLNTRAGFARDLEAATGRHITEVSVEYRAGEVLRVEIEVDTQRRSNP